MLILLAKGGQFCMAVWADALKFKVLRHGFKTEIRTGVGGEGLGWDDEGETKLL